MKKNWRIYFSVVACLMYVLFMGYMTYWNFKYQNPRLIAFVKTPTSWGDVGLGFIMGAVTIILVMLLPVVWSYRKNGDGGPGGGKINLPIIGKVISIDELKKMPPKGPVQRALDDVDIDREFSEMVRNARRM